MPPPDEPPSGPTETRRRRVVAVVAALVLGVVIGVLTSVLQGRLDFPWLALVNAASPWLTTAFVAGALQPRLRTALWAGLGATMLQVVAYYATADLRGFGVSARYLTLWSACAVAGGPVFGVAGHLWRRAAPAGLGAALLVGGRAGPDAVQEPPEAGRDGDDDREGHPEHREREERRHGERDEPGPGQGPPTHPPHGLHHHGDHRRREAREHGRDQHGVARHDVDRREDEQGEHAGQDEQGARGQAAADAVEQPADVDRELLRLGTGQQHAVVQRVQEPALTDPAAPVDQLALHHGDLAGRAAEGLPGDREPRAQRRAERDQVRRRSGVVGRAGRGTRRHGGWSSVVRGRHRRRARPRR